MTTEQKTLERLRATLYPNGQEKARESKPEPAARRKFRLVLKGKPMNCAKCGRLFGGGEFRVLYQAGAFCRHCYGLISLAPLSAKCIVCKNEIAIGDWRYRLWAISQDDDGDLKRWFVHQQCEREMRRPLSKAA